MERGADIVVHDLSDIEIAVRIGQRNSAALPSALDRKEVIAKRLHEGVPGIFLDYDGTLTPIVQDPTKALLSMRTRTIIGKLAEHWTVVIVSGRGLEDVKEMVGLGSVFYSGSHGFSIEGPGKCFVEQRGQEFLPALEAAGAELDRAFTAIPGARVEHKPFAIAIHYRQVDEKYVPEIERRVEEVCRRYATLRKTTGKKIFELRPAMDWDKGKALLYLIDKFGVDGSRIVPLFIGDDTTDEDAFRAIEKRGISIVVGDEDRSTAALYRLRDPKEVTDFLEELVRLAERGSSMDPWKLVYEDFDPAQEKLREALCTLGNGYLASRGAAPESTAGDIHYPGTYMNGVYNRVKSTVKGHTVENESIVNIPDWLSLTFSLNNGDWFDIGSVRLRSYRQELDMRKGILTRIISFTDEQGRQTHITQRRFVHIRHFHLMGMETTINPENWSGTLRVRSGLDGRVTNGLVLRYRQLNNLHLEQQGNGVTAEGIIWLETRTNQSHIRISEAARTRIFRTGTIVQVEPVIRRESGYIGQEFQIDIREGEELSIEKTVAIYNSRDRAISNSLTEAQDMVSHAPSFVELLEQHVLGWDHLWDYWHITVKAENLRMAQILNLHIFHLLQTVSPNTIDLDAGVPPRGLHGEAYRGLIMWDELFIFPLLNLRMPDITRSLLRYRYRRLPRARYAAKEAGLTGAMFPWQSGSDGREETQTVHLNPESGRWIPDNSHLQRHINVAVPYNIWHYYQVTGDKEFLAFYGAEIIFEIARYWANKAKYNKTLDRYEICHVMGPDEFHDSYPDSGRPGVDNNAYTNVMVVWLLCHALETMEIISEDRQKEIVENMGLTREELERWDDISRKMRVVFHDDGIISQFEGYDKLEEFDWKGYREKYGDIHRLDRILEAEGDTPNRYKLSKQADVLMLFYLLSSDELGELLDRLGYRFESRTIPRNIDYYLQRTSHGSTLSRVVHSWVLARSQREMSWPLFLDALKSDISDIQGGTTHEGIHLGAMAGTVDIVQRCYTGIETRGDILRFNPYLPKGFVSVRFVIRYRGHRLDIQLADGSLRVSSGREPPSSIRVAFRDKILDLHAGSTMEFKLGEGHQERAAETQR
jgi:alpha,alpha-trehalase